VAVDEVEGLVGGLEGLVGGLCRCGGGRHGRKCMGSRAKPAARFSWRPDPSESPVVYN